MYVNNVLESCLTDPLFRILRYILTRWVEKLVPPLRRLTTIIMPHRDKRASLRSNTNTLATPKAKVTSIEKEVSEFRTMSAIQALKYGVEHRLNKTQGWLLRLLQKEGTVASAFILCLKSVFDFPCTVILSFKTNCF